jgi:hypothetical protein
MSLKTISSGKHSSLSRCRVSDLKLYDMIPGEPNGGRSENCVNMWSFFDRESHGFWNDKVSII